MKSLLVDALRQSTEKITSFVVDQSLPVFPGCHLVAQGQRANLAWAHATTHYHDGFVRERARNWSGCLRRAREWRSFVLERPGGIEPPSYGWKPLALPLSYGRN